MIVSMVVVAGLLQGSDSVIDRAGRVAARYGDTAAARRDGFGPLQVSRIADLTPFQGQHWLHRWRVFGGSPDPSSPSFVMYAPVEGRWQPAGVAYSRRVSRADPIPDDLWGARAAWHLHQPCDVVPGEGAALADGEADCRARGGAPRPPSIAMVHVWTIPNPEGPFAHDNVALPYWVVGLALPSAARLSTPRETRRTRILGLALGESFGAILPYARLVEVAGTLPGLADSLAIRRRAIRALVPRLLAAERAGDRRAWSALVDAAVREWGALRRLYAAAAPSPAVRAQLERQLARAAGEATGPHMH